MKKYFCDNCGEEKSPRNIKTFPVPCHLYEFAGKAGYVDNDWNAVSGRYNNIDLCNKCLNIAYTAALDALTNLPSYERKETTE